MSRLEIDLHYSSKNSTASATFSYSSYTLESSNVSTCLPVTCSEVTGTIVFQFFYRIIASDKAVANVGC